MMKEGGATVWADFLCYISDHHKATPWLLVEVKQPGDPLEQAVPYAGINNQAIDFPTMYLRQVIDD